MPIYVFRCTAESCDLRFEHLSSFTADAPACPDCGTGTRKIPAGFSLGGQADAGLSKERMPQTWRGTYHGDREYTGRLQRQWERRQRLEASYPELAGDQRPIIAHEGRYHDAPLRAGDPIVGGGPGSGSGPGPAESEPGPPRGPGEHGHEGHGHGHGQGRRGTRKLGGNPK